MKTKPKPSTKTKSSTKSAPKSSTKSAPKQTRGGRRELHEALARLPHYLSGEEDLSTVDGLMAAAALVLDRIMEDRPWRTGKWPKWKAGSKPNP